MNQRSRTSSRDEWFRSSAWDGNAQQEFRTRLARARPHKSPQYLRIKAIALRDSGQVASAKQLLSEVVNKHSTSFDCPFCLEMLGDIERDEGHFELAESRYREVLRRRPDLNATSGMVEVSLAEMLTQDNDPDRLNEAMRLLDSALKRRLAFNSQLFRWHVALVRIAGRLGDMETERRAASNALKLVDRGPQFSRHPTVGLARPNSETLSWLQKLAT